MNVKELKEALLETNVPLHAYTILGNNNVGISPLGAVSLEFNKRKKTWELIIIERGSRYLEEEYESEEEACNALYSTLVKYCTNLKTYDGKPVTGR
ncbi:MAG: hypothetical protein Q4G68_10705 [Planctomycetia bacterium]|nr:hypothetical protein [Planctomycetia bacterium]